jgi:hypothetical protein
VRLWRTLRRTPRERPTLTSPRSVVGAGEPIVVAWDAPGADDVRLEPGPSRLARHGWTELVLPRGRHRITLHARRGADATIAVIDVTVLPAGARPRPPRLPVVHQLRAAHRPPGAPAPLAASAVAPRMQVAPVSAPDHARPPLPGSRLRVPALALPPLRDS